MDTQSQPNSQSNNRKLNDKGLNKYNKNKYNTNTNVKTNVKTNVNKTNVNKTNENKTNENKTNENKTNENKTNENIDNKRLNFKELLFELNKLKKYQHSPKVDLHECNDLYIINVELPGVLLEDIKIEIRDGQVLLVSGIKHNNNNYDVTRTIYSECRYNNFMRRIKIPSTLDKNTLTKTMLNGILTIQVKKELFLCNKEIDLNKEEHINWADDFE